MLAVAFVAESRLHAVDLSWDANGGSAGQTDGGGGWLDANRWWDGAANQTWTSGDAASFGNGGNGGTITLANPTTVDSLTFNSFSGTYTLGTSGQSLTLDNGLTQNAGAGQTSIVSPILLGGPQTWSNDAIHSLIVSSAVNNAGQLLTVNGTGTADLTGVISGGGGLTKNGSGVLNFHTGNSNTYTGTTTINGGIIKIGTGATSLGTGNLTLNGGVLAFYWGHTFTRTLGSGVGEVQLLGGESGFSMTGNINGIIRLNNNSGYEVVWGSQYFNPSALVLQAKTAQNTSNITFENKIDLNGSTRTVYSTFGVGNGGGFATLSNTIRNSQDTPAGLIKTGDGKLNLNGANSYDGGTTLEDGILQLGNDSSLGATEVPLTVNGGLLNIYNRTVSVGTLTGSGGTIANNNNAARTLTVGSGNATGGDFQGVIADNTNSGSGSLELVKAGTGTITLSGANTYSGVTTISDGTLQIGSGGSSGDLATSEVINAGTLAYDRSDDFSIAYPIRGAGALVKQGTGTMIFPNPSIQSAQITISEGVLQFDQANSANQAASMAIAETGASLHLNFSGTQALDVLYIGETQMPSGVYKAIGSPAEGTELAQITGPGTLSATGDVYPPTVVSMTSDIDTYAVPTGTAVTYTITFNEDMDSSTVSAEDFANAGTAAITVETITEIAPGVFTVQVTPTGAGTLQLSIPVGATLADASSNALDSASALLADSSVPTFLSNEGLPQYIGASPLATNVGSTITMEMPEGAQPGDLLIVNLVNYATAGRSSISTVGTDWTTLKTGYLLSNDVNYRGGLYYREVLDGDGTTFTLNLSSDEPSATFAAAGVILAFSNVDMVTGPLANGSSAAVSNFKSVSVPTSAIETSYIYTNTPNALFLFLGMAIGDSAVNFSNWSNPPYPSNLTSGIDSLNEIYDASGAPGIKTISLGAAMGTKAAMGLNYNGTADLTSAIHNAGIQLALRPTTNGPLVAALQALKAHVTGEALLTSSQIGAHIDTVVSNRFSFRSSIDSVAAAMDLVHTYDELLGPLWVARNMPNRGSLQNDIHHAVFDVMQHLLEYGFNTANLTNNYDLLNNFAYGSAANFPGACPPPEDPDAIHTVLIDADYPNTWGRPVFGQNDPSPKPTGTYLAPGSIATVTVPQALVGRGYRVRVGAHVWDLSNKTAIRRLDRCTRSYAIDSTSTLVANPLGGGIYIEVPKYIDDVGVVSVQIQNAVRSPYFSAKSFHQTTLSEWQDIERHHAAPWADFQSEKFMMQVPTSWIYAMDDPVTLMADWDRAVDSLNDFMGFPRDRGRETIYNQVDLQLREVAFTPGYPAVNNAYNPNQDYGGYANNYLVRGPQYAPNFEFHELGHAYQFSKFPGEVESDVNLLHVAVFNDALGYSMDEAFRSSRTGRDYATLETTAIAWMMCDNFLNGNIMEQFEKQYALKGHAKFVEIARLFGWDRLSNYFESFNEDYENGITPVEEVDPLLLRLSEETGIDMRPLFHFWGVPPVNAGALDSSIQAAELPNSRLIYDTLVHYKSLVPSDNTTFRNFALGWHGRQPSIDGYSEERNHATRWDDYDASMAAATASRAQQIIDLYFPAGRPSDYGDWRSQWTEAVSDLVDPQVDLDGDGMSNGEERIWGLNPTSAMSRNPITFNSGLRSGTFSFTRRDPALTGHNYSVWTSTNLADWNEDTGAQQIPGTPDANGVQSVETILSPELLDEPSLFIQMRSSE